jgi:hypothetical protein
VDDNVAPHDAFALVVLHRRCRIRPSAQVAVARGGVKATFAELPAGQRALHVDAVEKP